MSELIAVVGMGRVGTSLATLLGAAGHPVVRVRRKTASGRGGLVVTEHALQALPSVVVLCVPDGALAAAAGQLPQGWRTAGDLVWLHTSGVQPGQALRGRVAGAVGSMHPLAPFPPAGSAPPDLRDVAFAVDGDPDALAAAEQLARALGGRPVRVAPSARVAWHLAAVLASNGVYALLEAARDVLEHAGIDASSVLPSLSRLAAASARAAEEHGLEAGATGPVVRGDATTVERHRSWIARELPALDPLYRELGDRLVEVAERAGGGASSTARVLAALHGAQGGDDPGASGGT